MTGFVPEMLENDYYIFLHMHHQKNRSQPDVKIEICFDFRMLLVLITECTSRGK